MKKILIFLFGISFSSVYAQNGYTHIGLRTGLGYKPSTNVAVSLDFTNKYNNSLELSFNFFKRNSEDYKNYTLGVVYKPNIIKNKNHMLKARLGAYGGSDSKEFLFGPNIGLEYNYSISPIIDIVLTNDNNYFINAINNNSWRTNIQIGFRTSI